MFVPSVRMVASARGNRGQSQKREALFEKLPARRMLNVAHGFPPMEDCGEANTEILLQQLPEGLPLAIR